MLFSLGVALARLRFGGTTRAMPVTVFNYLWALRYDNSSEEVAAMVLGSTVLAFLALPLLLLNVM